MARHTSILDSQTYEQSLREKEKNEVFSRWTKERLSTLREAVTAHDVLRYFGVSLKHDGSSQEEQISCPFHGKDNRPSARVYPPTGPSPSGLYCWTCQKRWDIVGIWKMFHGDDKMKFTVALRGLESAFGIIAPDVPEFYDEDEKEDTSQRFEEVQRLLQVCENRLLESRSSFDMHGYLTVGKLLDALYYAMDQDVMPLDGVEVRARLVLDKIGEKIRSA